MAGAARDQLPTVPAAKHHQLHASIAFGTWFLALVHCTPYMIWVQHTPEQLHGSKRALSYAWTQTALLDVPSMSGHPLLVRV